MKIKFIAFLFFFGILIAACSKEKSLKEYMTDSWQTTYLKMEMPTFENSDSLSVYEDAFDNNPELIAQSKYNKDGTFSAWFIDNEGQKISESKGNWKVESDSLFVDFFYNNRQMQVSYFIERTTEGFIAKSKYDWDEDGKYDDLLMMKTKRINTK